MSQATRIVLGFVAGLATITVLHGGMNLGWFADRSRPRLSVAHLPVT